MMDRSLLPKNKPFRELLLPFAMPYFLYIGLNYVPISSPVLVQALKLVSVLATMVYFRANYRFGNLSALHVLISLAALPLALLVWALPLYYWDGLENIPTEAGLVFLILRVLNSAVLVALFEELLVRVFVLEFAYQVGNLRKSGSLGHTFTIALDTLPRVLDKLPFSVFSVSAATLFFMLGHRPLEFFPAVLYFSFTNWVYFKTGSLWTCIFIHGFTNLALAGLALFI